MVSRIRTRVAVVVGLLAAVATAGIAAPAGASTLAASLTSSDAENVKCPGTATFTGTASGTPGLAFTFFVQSNFNGTVHVDVAPKSTVMPASGMVSEPFTEQIPILTTDANTVELVVSADTPGSVAITKTVNVSCYALPAPTNVHVVTSKATCRDVAGSSGLSGCESTILGGGLALAWDEKTSVDGYKLFRVDGGRHDQVAAMAETKPYTLVPSFAGPFPGRCYAVEAFKGNFTSKDSDQFCATDSSIAKSVTLDPAHELTIVDWSLPQLNDPSSSNCNALIPAPKIITALNNFTGNAFTVFFPFLRTLQSGGYNGSVQFSGLYVGGEDLDPTYTIHYSQDPFAIFSGLCTAGTPAPTPVRVGSKFGLAFDLKKYSGHSIYSADLKFDQSAVLQMNFSTAKFNVYEPSAFSCADVVGPANSPWWTTGGANFTFDTKKQLPIPGRGANSAKTMATDVSDFVSGWAKGNDAGDDGFIIDGADDTIGTQFTGIIGTCVSAYVNPRMDLVYF